MTPEQLDDLERLEKAATKAKWGADASAVVALHPDLKNMSRYYGGHHNGIAHLNYGEYIENPNAENDANFIALRGRLWADSRRNLATGEGEAGRCVQRLPLAKGRVRDE